MSALSGGPVDGGRAGEPADAAEIAHAALRGVVGAMAMTGMRMVTVDLGLVRETPPDAIARKRARGLLRRVPRGNRRAAIELVHWSYGAAGGVAFGALPVGLRRHAWAGPAFGLLSWVGFEAGIAPLLGLPHAKKPRAVERLAIAGDHLLYGLVLSEIRARPQEQPR
jgi:hypothetical protein